MYVLLNDIVADRARIRKGHLLKLRGVQHKYAAHIAAHARAVEHHARKLQRLHANINAEAIAIAGADYTNHHILEFNECESIAVQQADIEGGCSVEGIVDVVEIANTMANRADRVPACSVPLVLLSE